jgi:TPR repeat protein
MNNCRRGRKACLYGFHLPNSMLKTPPPANWHQIRYLCGMQKTLVVAMILLVAFWTNGNSQAPAFRTKAWSGDSVAMLALSEAFMFGKSVEKNEDSAKFYVKKAADKGLTDAQFLLGTELLVDVFSSANYAKGVALLQKAAAKGHVDAQFRLSEVYRSKGRGNVSDSYYDIKKGYSYSEMAALQGLPEALMYCAEARITGTGTTKNDSIACSFFRRAADEKSYVPAIIRMGDMYFEGRATGTVEPFIAVEWYRKALTFRHANIDQKGKAEHGIHNVDNFFKTIQNTYLESNPALPYGMFSYKIR